MTISIRRRALATTMAAAIGLVTGAHAAQGMELDERGREGIDRLVDAQAPVIDRNALAIWSYAEVGFKERRSSDLLQKTLSDAGFTLSSGAADMPTAFVARYRNGPGPVIAVLAEFDALPGISQDAKATAPKAVAGAIAGHACGHNLLGAGVVGAAVAISQWMAQNGIKGEIRVYGSPAEEGGDGKAYMVRAGLFNDVDAVLSWHPADRNLVMASPSQANIKTDFTFHGVSSHAANAPERGRSALAGLQVMDVAVNYMRQFTVDGTRIHGITVNGGKAPNVVPATAVSSYYVRHANIDVLKDVQARMIKAAQGAAIATETTVDWEIQGGVYPLLINDTLLEPVQSNLEREVAKQSMSSDEQAYAAALQKSLGVKADLTEIAVAEPITRLSYVGGSTDRGDISQIVPMVEFVVATWPRGTPFHSWASAGASGTSLATKGTVLAARVLAQTAIGLMLDPETLNRAKAELKAKQPADFRYQALFGDRAPPLTYTDKLGPNP